MKKFVVVLFTLSLLFTMSSTTGVYAAKEKTVLKVYNWGEYISNGSDDTLDVIAEFERRNPEIDVEYTTYATNEEMYAKIASGSANYDIVIPSDYMIARMINEDMLTKLDFNNIPNFKNINQQFKNLEYDPQNEYSVPYTWGTVGIVYNKTKVKGPIDSWTALWDPQYTNDILMFDNSRDSYGIALKMLGFSQNTTNKEELDKATEVLKDQKMVVQAYVMDEIFSKMPNGEAALAPYYAGDALTMIEDNPDLDFVVPKEGTNRFVDSMVVLKSSQNKALAEKFINYMLEPDIAKENIEFIGYSTPLDNVREMLDDDVKNSPISYPSDEILEKCDTFINLPEETNVYMQEGWVDVKAFGEDNIGALLFLIFTLIAILAFVIYLNIKKHIRNR